MDDQDLPEAPIKFRLPGGEYVAIKEYYDTTGFVRVFNSGVDGASYVDHFEWEGNVPHPFIFRQIVIALDADVDAGTRWRFATEGHIKIGWKHVGKGPHDIISKCYFEGPPFMAIAPKEALVQLANALFRGVRGVVPSEGRLAHEIRERELLVPPSFDWLAGMALSLPVYYRGKSRWTVRIDIPKGLTLRGAIAGVGLLCRPAA